MPGQASVVGLEQRIVGRAFVLFMALFGVHDGETDLLARGFFRECDRRDADRKARRRDAVDFGVWLSFGGPRSLRNCCFRAPRLLRVLCIRGRQYPAGSDLSKS